MRKKTVVDNSEYEKQQQEYREKIKREGKQALIDIPLFKSVHDFFKENKLSRFDNTYYNGFVETRMDFKEYSVGLKVYNQTTKTYDHHVYVLEQHTNLSSNPSMYTWGYIEHFHTKDINEAFDKLKELILKYKNK